MFKSLPVEVRWALAGVFALLVVSSIVIRVLRSLKPNQNYDELFARVRTWWIIVILFSLAFVGSRGLAITFFGFISYLALKEYLSLVPTRRADRRVLFWAYLAVPLQYYWVYAQWYGMFIVFIPVYMFLLLPTRMISIGKTDGFIRAMGTIHWGLMTTVFSLSHIAFLLILKPVDSARMEFASSSEMAALHPGPGLLLILVLLTQLNDVAQYVWGKSLGKIKVVPEVSPGKTLGGLLGGVATTVALAAVIGPVLTIMDFIRSLLAGLVIGIGGFAGDLSISALKRDLGVKDSGNTLPGHGGVLDRVDSLTYTAPLFFHFVYYCYF